MGRPSKTRSLRPDHFASSSSTEPDTSLNMASTTAAVPVSCCGREGGCACAKEATCSCGKQPALHCNCEKAQAENKTAGARCSCRKRPAGSCTCSRSSTENTKPTGATCARPESIRLLHLRRHSSGPGVGARDRFHHQGFW